MTRLAALVGLLLILAIPAAAADGTVTYDAPPVDVPYHAQPADVCIDPPAQTVDPPAEQTPSGTSVDPAPVTVDPPRQCVTPPAIDGTVTYDAPPVEVPIPTDPPPPPAAQCADGQDNDGDGKVDYPADPGCASASDDDEMDPAPPPPPQGTANLWVDTNGGSCARSSTLADYADASACGSLDAANDKCQAGDTVIIKGGSYPDQTLSGSNGRSGYCTFESAAGEVAVIGSSCSNNGPVACLDVTSGGWWRLDGGANKGIRAKAFSGHGIDLGVTTWYGSFDTERGDCNHLVFQSVHVGSMNLICPSSQVVDSELGPSIDHNTKLFEEADGLLLKHNWIHDYDVSNSDQHMECLYGYGIDNLTLDGNVVGPCDIISMHMKENAPFDNNTLVNNIFLPGASGAEVQYGYACSNLTVLNNIFMDGFDDVCTGTKVRGNIFYPGNTFCGSGADHNISIGEPACGAGSLQATEAELFADGPGRDFHPRAGSPALDALPSCPPPATDLEGKARPVGAACDIGPYETG